MLKFKIKKMREVIRIDKKEENEKPVEFTHKYNIREMRWDITDDKPSSFDFVVHRKVRGEDYFICWGKEQLIASQFIGHLNSGKYE